MFVVSVSVLVILICDIRILPSLHIERENLLFDLLAMFLFHQTSVRPNNLSIFESRRTLFSTDCHTVALHESLA